MVQRLLADPRRVSAPAACRRGAGARHDRERARHLRAVAAGTDLRHAYRSRRRTGRPGAADGRGRGAGHHQHLRPQRPTGVVPAAGSSSRSIDAHLWRRRRIAEIRKKMPPSAAYPATLVRDAFAPPACRMKVVPARTEIPPLRIIAHWPPRRRRRIATTSCTMPAVIAQAPHTRRTLGTPEAAAMARPTVASRLNAMLRYSGPRGRLAPEERKSITAAATSKSG